jgi:hypothetical protein
LDESTPDRAVDADRRTHHAPELPLGVHRIGHYEGVSGFDERTSESLDPATVTIAGGYVDTHGYAAQRVGFDLLSPDVPVLVALVLRTSERGRFARFHRHHGSHSAHLQFQIHYEWEIPTTGRRVFTVSLAQHAPRIGSAIQVNLDAEGVDGGPQDEGLIRFERHSTLKCGSVAQIAEVAEWGVRAEVFVVAKHDTTRSHGRWSVRKEMANDLPASYGFLLTGKTAGDL